MNVTFSCPSCQATNRAELNKPCLECQACHLILEIPADALVGGQPEHASLDAANSRLERCVVCPCRELFVRKDFPQRLGVAIVFVGFALSCVTWYYYYTYATFGILFATALIDLLLYFSVRDALVCYQCHAHYRSVPGLERHSPFNLETYERHRQQAARLKQALPHVASHDGAGSSLPVKPS